MPKTEKSGDNAAEERSTPVNWEEFPETKAEWRRSIVAVSFFGVGSNLLRQRTCYVFKFDIQDESMKYNEHLFCKISANSVTLCIFFLGGEASWQCCQ